MQLTTDRKRLIGFLVAAFVPVVILAVLFPGRAMQGTQAVSTKYVPSPGADIVAFVQDECPHCGDIKEFAEEQGWTIDYQEIKQLSSQQLFTKVQERSPGLQQRVPTIYLNGDIMQGYTTDAVSGKRLKELYDECRDTAEGCLPIDDFLKIDTEVNVISAVGGVCTTECELDLEKYIFDFWFIGEVDLTLLSLPTLSILLGLLDGFNPCAMWVLISLLTLLIATRDMRKMIIIGGVFLIVSGAMYYLFIAAWLNVFLLLGYNVWVQKIIGLIAIGAGGFYLFEAFGRDPTTCKVTSGKQKMRTLERMKNLIHAAAWPVMLLGVSILAISVNTIELVCTAGLPAIFTQIIAFNNIGDAYRYFLIGLYILLYMIDDTIIFLIAIFTMHATGMTTKYQQFTLTFGGVLMYILGLLLLFAPGILSF